MSTSEIEWDLGTQVAGYATRMGWSNLPVGRCLCDSPEHSGGVCGAVTAADKDVCPTCSTCQPCRR